MVEQIVVKEFRDLTLPEIRRLFYLTNQGPSGFSIWLTHPDHPQKYAAMLSQNDQIVGWAAAKIESFNRFQIGAYVLPRKRGQGIGKRALHALLDNITSRQGPQFAEYQLGKEGFFQPVLDQFGYRIHHHDNIRTVAQHERFDKQLYRGT